MMWMHSGTVWSTENLEIWTRTKAFRAIAIRSKKHLIKMLQSNQTAGIENWISPLIRAFVPSHVSACMVERRDEHTIMEIKNKKDEIRDKLRDFKWCVQTYVGGSFSSSF